MKIPIEIFENDPEQHNVISNTILSKTFAPNESAVAAIKFPNFKKDSGSVLLVIKNDKGQLASFSWQKNVVSTRIETGYFKEITNDLGVVIHHNEDSVTIINGGARQFLTAELEL